MTDVKHTKLDWECQVTELSEGITATVYDEQGHLMVDGIEEWRARLIAAAPELLALLDEAADFIQPFNRADALLEKIEAAIAKARGGS